MALFTIITQLQLSVQDKARFERIAAALEAIAAKVTEPDPPPADDAAIQAQIDALTARLTASSDRLEAQTRPTL